MNKDLQAIATVGTFDGVHLGHRFLVEQVTAAARRRGLRPLVITFDRHPSSLFGYNKPSLTTLDDKRLRLRSMGVEVVVMPFDHALATLSALTFMELLRDEYQVCSLVIGYDNRFGHKGTQVETLSDYVRYGRQLGIDVIGAPPCPPLSAGVPSSSLIRSCLLAGRIDEANSLLGYAYTLHGRVVHGRHVGTQMGFPTANLTVGNGCLVPQSGVYAVRCTTEEASQVVYDGMMNIGTRPTFAGGGQTIEVHLFDFQGDLYGQQLTVSVVSRLRSEQPFPSAEALSQQLQLDKEAAKSRLSS